MQSAAQETNKRLFYAQTLLTLSQQRGEGTEQQSLEYSCWLCVQAAWKAWLQELVDSAGNPIQGIADYQQLKASPLQQNAAVQHLINLESSPDSWLSQLLAQCGLDDIKTSVLNNGKNAAGFNSTKASGGLTLKSLDEADTSSLDRLAEVLSGFKDYIQFTREQQVEW